MHRENNPKVAVIRVKDSLPQAIEQGLDYIGGIEAHSDDKIIIKPNLCHPSPPDTGRTTDVRVVEEIVNRCEKIVDNDIYIVESDNYATTADKTFKRLGYKQLKKRHPIQLLNISKEPKTRMKIDGKCFETIEVPNFLLTPNYFITVAKLKVHLHELYTGVWKNQWGCLVQKEKRCFHPFLNEALVDINTVWKPRLCIVDGIVGMEGCGPIDGVPKPMDLLICGKDPIAVDSVCCHIMKINPYYVPHLRFAHENNLGTIDLEEIEILGESIQKVSTQFALPPDYSVRLMRWGVRLGRFPPPLINLGLASFNLGNNYAGKKNATRFLRQKEEKSSAGFKKMLRKLWTRSWNV
jgi:uncharacterized protein (DUF362 family)